MSSIDFATEIARIVCVWRSRSSSSKSRQRRAPAVRAWALRPRGRRRSGFRRGRVVGGAFGAVYAARRGSSRVAGFAAGGGVAARGAGAGLVTGGRSVTAAGSVCGCAGVGGAAAGRLIGAATAGSSTASVSTGKSAIATSVTSVALPSNSISTGRGFGGRQRPVLVSVREPRATQGRAERQAQLVR